jgi:uncharacterized iron-regulated membrane protein
MNDLATIFRQRLPSVRKIWLNLCQCLGLFAGLLFALIGLTGAVLVFNGPMLRMEVGPTLFVGKSSLSSHVAIDEWIANAQRVYGDLNAIESVSGPGYGFAEGTTLVSEAAGSKHLVVSINPDSGRPLGRFIWEDTYTTSVLRLHVRLAALLPSTKWGRHAVGWIAAALILSTAAGLYLWWPIHYNWRSAFTPEREAHGLRRLLDFHNLAAICLVVPLLILVLTGIYLAYPGSIDPALSLVSVARAPDNTALAQASKPGACASPTTPGQALTLAQARFPSARFVSLALPKNQPYVVRLAPPNNVGDKGQTLVFVDRECPTVLTVIDGEIGVAAETFKALMHPLHRYLMLGHVGQALAFLAGLLLPLSFVTFLLLWLHRRNIEDLPFDDGVKLKT